MNAAFTPPRHSKSSCCLAPRPPTRKGSRQDMEKMSSVSSVPAELLTCCGKPSPTTFHNAVFSNRLKAPSRGFLQPEKRMSPPSSLKAASSMMFDHASRQRTAAAKSIVLTRSNNSCDRMPSMPVRVHSPVKARRQTDTTSSSWNDSTSARKSGCLTHTEGNSAVIRKPDIKSNMFLQTMESSAVMSNSSKHAKSNRKRVSKSKSEGGSHPAAHIKLLRMHRSPSSIIDAAELGASELSDTDHLISRWDSSSSLSYPVRPHESLSSSLEFFLNKEEARMSQ